MKISFLNLNYLYWLSYFLIGIIWLTIQLILFYHAHNSNTSVRILLPQELQLIVSFNRKFV